MTLKIAFLLVGFTRAVFAARPGAFKFLRWDEFASSEQPTSASYWESVVDEHLKWRLAKENNVNKAKNVILFLGDGMGVTVCTKRASVKGEERFVIL